MQVQQLRRKNGTLSTTPIAIIPSRSGNHLAASPEHCLEGQGEFVGVLIRELTKVTIWARGLINLLTKSP